MIKTTLPLCGRYFCTLLLLFSVFCHAEIYRSIDEHGNAHYSDRPQASSEIYQTETPIQPMPKPQLPTLKNTPKSAPKKTSSKAAKAKKLAQRKKRCESIEKRIKKVNYKLRQAHSNKQGNSLRKKRREYSDQLSKECRGW